MRYTLFTIFLFFILGCTQEKKHDVVTSKGEAIPILYAKGFNLESFPDYQLLTVNAAFPEAKDSLRYALVRDMSTLSRKRKQELYDQGIEHIIQIPIKRVVVTSTTHIPSLEMLEVEKTLVGFPNLDYISSEKTRQLIDNKRVAELGQNESLNTEVTIDLQPDAVVGFGVDGQNKALTSLQKAQIPVLYNGDWVELNPLGKAEWIKFFGALYDKNEEAQTLFNSIASEYVEAKKLASQAKNKPTVLSGGLFKDVWYVPNGDSWPAKLIADAGGKYLWAETSGTGSISLSIESVLEKAQTADVWIAPGQYTSYDRMQNDYEVYTRFEAFQNKKVYTFASKKGATGGLLYYELAPNRPDLVLKDMIHYLHPELLKNYKPFFFSPLEE